MRYIYFALCLLLIPSNAARAQTSIAFGSAVPGQNIEQIVDALPQADWRFFHSAADHALVGAIASGAVEFAGERWTLRLGSTNPSGGAFAYSFELTRSSRYEREDQCATELSHAITALEPSLGAFASGSMEDIHPSLGDSRRNESVEVSAGNMSHARTFPRPRTRDRDRGYDMIAIRNVEIGAATIASVNAINTRDRYNGPRSEYTVVVGYLCFVTIGFRAPAGSVQP